MFIEAYFFILIGFVSFPLRQGFAGQVDFAQDESFNKYILKKN